MASGAAAKKSRWWDGDPTQRYWMELVSRPDWGTELISPDEGRYSHMWDVREGDVVFHWLGVSYTGAGKSGIYGHSIVIGPPETAPENQWRSTTGPGVRVPLGDFVPADPLLLHELANSAGEITAVKDQLMTDYGSPVYFPFQDGSGGFRPREAYLAKVPRAVVDIIAGLRPDTDWGGFEQVPLAPFGGGQNGVKQSYAGFCADPILKKAIETQAVHQAMAHYAASGYVVEDVGAYESFDLRATRGDEVRHVEVKGSQGHVQKVILTRNEVTHANEFDRTDLVVVADIEWERRLDGSIATENGVMSLYPDWRPSPENLKPLSYEYVLD